MYVRQVLLVSYLWNIMRYQLMDVTKTRNGEWGMENGEWGMGNGEWGMGNGEWGIRNSGQR